jgi:hypothetical protein
LADSGTHAAIFDSCQRSFPDSFAKDLFSPQLIGRGGDWDVFKLGLLDFRLGIVDFGIRAEKRQAVMDRLPW